MNQLRIKRDENDFYKINIADDGTEIIFDLADIGLGFRCQKAFERVKKNEQITLGKIQAVNKKYKDNEVRKEGIFTNFEKEIYQLYGEMFAENRKIMDEFFNCEGAIEKLFGDSNYIDMYDDLFEAFEPHFKAMNLNVENIKNRLSKKYQKRSERVLREDELS